MLSAEDNARLTRVSAGTPMGETWRRYWFPALLSEELPGVDCAPVRVRLLGEDLIAFRDSAGKTGLVDAFCPHRRAPLFFGRNEECGLRCVYHGWKFDVTGKCVERPSSVRRTGEPPGSLFKTPVPRTDEVALTAYPTWEGGGFVWTYMGPHATMPAPPDYEFVRTPATHRYPSKTLEECNWLQALEGGLDSSHATIMHRFNIGDLAWLDDYDATIPRIEVERTGYGYTYSGVRRTADTQWVRVYHYAMPAMQMRGTIQGGDFKITPRIDGHIWVPIDDTTTWVFNFMYAYDPATPLPLAEALAVEQAGGRGPGDLLPGYRSKRNAGNDYLIDRGLQKTTSFTGITGVNTQDFAVQEGMGPIVDRSKEHLGTTDRPIITMRALLLEATHDVAAGRMPRGSDPADSRTIRPVDHVVPLADDWRVTLKDELLARY